MIKDFLKSQAIFLIGMCFIIVSSFVIVLRCYGNPYTPWMMFQYTPWWGWLLLISGFVLVSVKIKD